jgi:serine/threonine-protein kinase
MTLAPGTKLGPYEMLSPVGAAGMGEVWKARDTRLGRTVAIKKVKEQHSERFRQEARTIAALNHPYICQLHDIGNDSPVATALALVKDEPLPLQASPALEKIVRQCLAKQPSERYQGKSEVKATLEQVFGEKTTGSSAEAQPSIAVLPFVNMSGDKEQEYFSDGLAEEIINALTQIPGLRVIARTSAFAFKGKQEDIRKIAEILGVTSILEGSVRKAGNRIRATAQLIDASSGSHLWSERFDRDMTDVFAIQDEISQAIAEKLRVRLSGVGPLVKRRTENVEAYNLRLKGRYHLFKFTPERSAKSREYFEQALVVDPNCALAWCSLAAYYFGEGSFGLMPPKEASAQSRQAVRKALELDERLPQAHSQLAVLLSAEYDWRGAEREFRRALELGPEMWDV